MLTMRFLSYYSLIIRRSFMKDYNFRSSTSRCVTEIDKKEKKIEKNAIYLGGIQDKYADKQYKRHRKPHYFS